MAEFKFIGAPPKIEDWKNKHVLSNYPVSNSLGAMPAGTIFKITSSGITKYIETLPCQSCGFVFKVTTKQRRNSFLQEFKFIEIIIS